MDYYHVWYQILAHSITFLSNIIMLCFFELTARQRAAGVKMKKKKKKIHK